MIDITAKAHTIVPMNNDEDPQAFGSKYSEMEKGLTV